MSGLTLASDLLIAAGLLFVVTGAVGLYRMPDFFTRTHAAGITDSAGAGLVLLGLLLRVDGYAEALRLLLIALFLLFTSPTATHALAQSALEDGLRPLLDDRRRRR
ncbi:MAG: monovalent cation/H(+) antiporter subunit G [Pseudomonadota bacterium]